MSLPTNIAREIAYLQTQVTAAAPLTSAPRATLLAMQLNADQLVADTEAALETSSGALDNWTPPIDPQAIIAGVLALETSAFGQTALANCRGLVGRIASNLNQLPT